MKSARHLVPINLSNWIIFYVAREETVASDFASSLNRVASSMGIRVAPPEPYVYYLIAS